MTIALQIETTPRKRAAPRTNRGSGFTDRTKRAIQDRRQNILIEQEYIHPEPIDPAFLALWTSMQVL